MDEQRITVDGQELAYAQSEGQGRPVIFVHGNSSSSRTWDGIMAGPFGQRYRCLALDLPGHGDSAPAKNREDYSLPGYAHVLTGFGQATDATDAVVVGWSLGGHIALEAAPHLPAAAGGSAGRTSTTPVSSAAPVGPEGGRPATRGTPYMTYLLFRPGFYPGRAPEMQRAGK